MHVLCPQMLIDVLTDRGFKASHSLEVAHVPVQLDLTTGLIKNRKETKHRFRINWDSRNIRELNMELEPRVTPGSTEAMATPRISQSFMPPPQQAPPVRGAKTATAAAVAAAAASAAAQAAAQARLALEADDAVPTAATASGG